jgi:hypothetical protein
MALRFSSGLLTGLQQYGQGGGESLRHGTACTGSDEY